MIEFSKKVKQKMIAQEEESRFGGVQEIVEETEPRGVPFYETGGEIYDPDPGAARDRGEERYGGGGGDTGSRGYYEEEGGHGGTWERDQFGDNVGVRESQRGEHELIGENYDYGVPRGVQGNLRSGEYAEFQQNSDQVRNLNGNPRFDNRSAHQNDPMQYEQSHGHEPPRDYPKYDQHYEQNAPGYRNSSNFNYERHKGDYPELDRENFQNLGYRVDPAEFTCQNDDVDVDSFIKMAKQSIIESRKPKTLIFGNKKEDLNPGPFTERTPAYYTQNQQHMDEKWKEAESEKRDIQKKSYDVDARRFDEFPVPRMKSPSKYGKVEEILAPKPRQRSPSKYVLDQNEIQPYQDILERNNFENLERQRSNQESTDRATTQQLNSQHHLENLNYQRKSSPRNFSGKLDDYQTKKSRSPNKVAQGLNRMDSASRKGSGLNLKLFQEYQKKESKTRFEKQRSQANSLHPSAKRSKKSLRSSSKTPPKRKNFEINPKAYNLDLKSDVFGTLHQDLGAVENRVPSGLIAESDLLTARSKREAYPIFSPRSINMIHNRSQPSKDNNFLGPAEGYSQGVSGQRNLGIDINIDILGQNYSPRNYSLENPKIQSTISRKSKNQSMQSNFYQEKEKRVQEYYPNLKKTANQNSMGMGQIQENLNLKNPPKANDIKILNRILPSHENSIKIEDLGESAHTHEKVEIMEDMIIPNLVIEEDPKSAIQSGSESENEEIIRPEPNINFEKAPNNSIENESVGKCSEKSNEMDQKQEFGEHKGIPSQIEMINYRSEEQEIEEKIDTILQQQSYLHLQEFSEIESDHSQRSKSCLTKSKSKKNRSKSFKSPSIEDSLYKFENYPSKFDGVSEKDSFDPDLAALQNQMKRDSSHDNESQNSDGSIRLKRSISSSSDYEESRNGAPDPKSSSEIESLQSKNNIPKSATSGENQTNPKSSQSMKQNEITGSEIQNSQINDKNIQDSKSDSGIMNYKSFDQENEDPDFNKFNNDFGESGTTEISKFNQTEEQPEPPNNVILQKEELSLYIQRKSMDQEASHFILKSGNLKSNRTDIIERKDFRVDIQIPEFDQRESAEDDIIISDVRPMELTNPGETMEHKFGKKTKLRESELESERHAMYINPIQLDTQELDIPQENEEEIIKKAREIILNNLDNREFMKQIFKEIKKNKEAQNIRIIDHNEQNGTNSEETEENKKSKVSDVSIISLDSNSEEEQMLEDHRTVTAQTYMGSNFKWNDNGLVLSEQSTNFIDPSRIKKIQKNLDTMETCQRDMKQEDEDQPVENLLGMFCEAVDKDDDVQVIEDDLPPQGPEEKRKKFNKMENVRQMEQNLLKLKKRFSITKEQLPTSFKKQNNLPLTEFKDLSKRILRIFKRNKIFWATLFWKMIKLKRYSDRRISLSGKKPNIKKKSLKKNREDKYDILNSSRRKSLSKIQYVPLETTMTRESVCPFENMTQISKISKHKKLVESKDFGNYTIHSKSFSLYEPQNNLINLGKLSKKRKTEENRSNRFVEGYDQNNSQKRNKNKKSQEIYSRSPQRDNDLMKKYLTNENPKIRRKPSCDSDFHVMKNIDLHFQDKDISSICKETPSRMNINPERLFEQTPVARLNIHINEVIPRREKTPNHDKNPLNVGHKNPSKKKPKNFERKKRRRFEHENLPQSNLENQVFKDEKEVSPILPGTTNTERILDFLDIEKDPKKTQKANFENRKKPERESVPNRNQSRRGHHRTQSLQIQTKIKESAFYDMINQMQDNETELECKNTLLSQETENNWLESIYKKD